MAPTSSTTFKIWSGGAWGGGTAWAGSSAVYGEVEHQAPLCLLFWESVGEQGSGGAAASGPGAQRVLLHVLP